MSLKFWKTAITILSIFQITQAWNLRHYLGSIDVYLEYTHENSDQICTSGHYDASRDTYGFIHAYKSKLENEAPEDLLRTLIAKGSWNVLGVDWSKEANSYLIGFDYVVFAKQVAIELALAFRNMHCLRPEKTHLTGIAIGAHMAGIAGRDYSEKTGNLIGEIVAMDPARILYQDPNFFEGVNTSSGGFVQQISSDTYKYGISDPRGHINFFCNLDQYLRDHHQPGCPPNLPPPFYTLSNEDLCSHRCSLLWYTDSFKYPGELVGTKYDTVGDWVASGGAPNQITCLGYLVNKEKFGNYYLTTNLATPFGQGLRGIAPITTVQ